MRKEARNLLYRLGGCNYMWLYVLGRKINSDVDICLFGTVVHSADGVQNVVYLAHNQGITGAGSLRVVLVYRRFDSAHQH